MILMTVLAKQTSPQNNLLLSNLNRTRRQLTFVEVQMTRFLAAVGELNLIRKIIITIIRFALKG